MDKHERRKVIIDYLQNNFMVNVLDSEFVDHYIEKTGVKFSPQVVGAHRCSSLTSDLHALYTQGSIDRCVSGLPGAGVGFPKWVYCYALPGKF